MDQIEFDVTCPYCGMVFRASSVPSSQVECECPHCHQLIVFDAPDKGDELCTNTFVEDSSDVVLPTSSAIDAKNECPNCHAKIEEGSSFCGSCGYKLSDQTICNNEEKQTEMGDIYCPRCGQKCEANEKFCGKCGAPLSNEAFPVGGVTSTVTQDTPPVYYDEDDDDNHNMRILLAIFAVILLLGGGLLLWKYLSGGHSLKKSPEVVSDSIHVDSLDTWEPVTFVGKMYDEEGNLCNMQVTFETDGTNVRNCIYKNVDLGGKIKMNIAATDDTYSFKGKDGSSKFSFSVNKNDLIGPGKDGKKGLLIMMHKEGEAPAPKPTPVEMSLWSYDSNFPGDIDVKGQIGWYKNESDKYILRVVSYDKRSGRCVLEAYLRGKTIGKFVGNYSTDSFIDDEGYEHYDASYNGTFHYTDGRQKDFQFFVD